MFLSKRDMRSFPVLAVIVVLILIFIARLGHLEWFRANLTYSISQIALALNTSLMFVLLIDLGCIVFLFVIQKVLEKISGRRIVAASK